VSHVELARTLATSEFGGDLDKVDDEQPGKFTQSKNGKPKPKPKPKPKVTNPSPHSEVDGRNAFAAAIIVLVSLALISFELVWLLAEFSASKTIGTNSARCTLYATSKASWGAVVPLAITAVAGLGATYVSKRIEHHVLWLAIMSLSVFCFLGWGGLYLSSLNVGEWWNSYKSLDCWTGDIVLSPGQVSPSDPERDRALKEALPSLQLVCLGLCAWSAWLVARSLALRVRAPFGEIGQEG